MTKTAKEQCVDILARMAELVQSCEDPKSKAKLLKAHSIFKEVVDNTSEDEAELVISIFQAKLDEISGDS